MVFDQNFIRLYFAFNLLIPRQTLGLACCSMLEPNAQRCGKRQKTYGEHRDGKQEPHVPVSSRFFLQALAEQVFSTPTLVEDPCNILIRRVYSIRLNHCFCSTLLDRSCEHCM